VSVLTRSGCPLRKDSVSVRPAGSETVLHDLESGTTHMLNETAFAMWELCDGRTRPEEMVEAICMLCAVELETVLSDVERALSELEGVGLITWRP
jgi:hypothetical protein